MKKILLAFTLLLGLQQSIQPSYFSTAFQSFKSCLTPGSILAYTVLPAVGTYFAYNTANKDVVTQLANNQAQVTALGEGLNGLVNQLNKKESTWLDSLGMLGTALGGAYTAYRFLQAGLGEYMSAMQILAVINSIKNGVQGTDENEQKQQEEQPQTQGPRKLRPAQRRAA
jgi:hypothetical protein